MDYFKSDLGPSSETEGKWTLKLPRLDLNPLAWAKSALADQHQDCLSLEQTIQSLCLFCNAHLSLKTGNELAVYGAGLGSSELLFSTLDGPDATEDDDPIDGTTYQEFRLMDQRIAAGARAMLSAGGLSTEKPLNLVGALSRSLCYSNRIARDESHPPVQPRVLILSVTPDASAQYISMMNCIFSAQKSGIPIDVCKIYGEEAVFLQQAAFLTSGLYYHIERRAGLLQYLMMAFLPGRASRKHLNLPHQDQVDLRAACFCHRKIVDIGFVCSVCLSMHHMQVRSRMLLCRRIDSSFGRTNFPLASLKRLAQTRGTLKK